MKVKVDKLRDYFFALLCLISFCVLIYVNNSLYRIMIVIFCLLIYSYVFYVKGNLKLRISGIHKAWFLFVAWCVLSSVWAYGKVNLMDILMLVLVGIVSLGVFNYIKTEKEVLIFFKSIIITAMIMEMYLIGRYGLTALMESRIDNDVLNSNVASRTFAIGVMLSIYIFFKEHKKRYIIFGGILAFGALLMGSKTGSFAFVIFSVVFFVLKDKGNIIKNLRNILVALALIAVVFYVMFKVEFLYRILGERIIWFVQSLQGGNVSRSTDIRMYLITNGIEQFMHAPIFGVGLANYSYLNIYHTYAHSNLVEIAVDLGIIGVCLFYSMHFMLIKKISKNKNTEQMLKALVIAILVVYLFFEFSTVYYSSFLEIFILVLMFRYLEIGARESK